MREDGKVIYARTWSYSDSKQSFEHKLYRIDLLGTVATSPKLENGYDWGVFAGKTFMGRDFSGSGGAADYTQTIFLNGKEVVSDVSGYASLPYYCEKTGKLYYYEFRSGNLMEYNGRTSREVCQRVKSYTLLENGSVLLTVYSEDGDAAQDQLWLWTGIRLVQLDEGNVILASWKNNVRTRTTDVYW